MFSKLLKYDFRAVKRFAIIILTIIAVAAVLGSVDLAYICGLIKSGALETDSLFSVLSMTSSVFMMYFVVFLLGLASTAMLVVSMIHFYKNLVTDEGYLTFTLPVTPKQILLSKFTNSTLCSLAVSVATGIAIVIIVLVGFGVSGLLGEFFSILWEGIKITTWQFWVIMVLMSIFGLVSLANTHLLYYMAIILGSIIVKKNKALAAIGCVVGVGFIYSSVTSTVYTILMSTTAFFENVVASIIILLSVAIVLLAGLSYLFYYLTERMLSRSLNLP